MKCPFEPLVSRNFALFLLAVAALVLAVPFADRRDWQGWVASFVSLAALGTMLVLWSLRTWENFWDWWHDDRESPF